METAPETIKTTAVIGAGVMGAGIAAHMANSGVKVYLLDIVADGNINRKSIAETAIQRLLRSSPPAFTHADHVHRIIPGNIEDQLALLKNVD